MIEKILENNKLQTALVGAIVVFTTLYAYLNATLIDRIGDGTFVILFFLAFTLFLLRGSQSNNAVIVGYWIYLGLSIISCAYADYASMDWLRTSFVRLSLCIFIPFYMLKLKPGDMGGVLFVLVCLTIILPILVILDHYNLFDKRWLSFITPLTVFEQLPYGAERWCGKYFSSWLVILTMGTAGLLWRAQSRGSKSLIAVIFLISTVAVLLLPSNGARLAIICSVGLFVIFNFVPYRKYFKMYCVGLFLPVVVPLLLTFLIIVFLSGSVGNVSTAGKSQLVESILARVVFYDDVVTVFKDKPVIGQGFGSVRNLYYSQGGDIIDTGGERDVFLGGHPHSIPLLVLLEHGLIGVMLYLGAMFLFFREIYKRSAKDDKSEFVLPMFLSFSIMYSLSFSIWQADVVLLILFFFLMIRFVLELPQKYVEEQKIYNV